MKNFFEGEWNAKAEPTATSTLDAGAKDDALLAAAALILAVPGTVLATLQLLELAQLKRRLDGALQELRSVLRVGDKTLDLRTATAEELLDAVAEEEKKLQQ